ncbi:MmcQ/YjbR family DNA-binding protein [Longispora albida]|uniref:MmcQ/YjbR family DNA-binding protein n=1 Tax=Longispora albida TaxID=203523 RepID=UPI000366F0A3|nr:MmcQ/YjbR family DNA-binding protein [Longispora albida]
MTGPGDVPPEYLAQLRPVCLGLPEACEEAAWVGLRWRIRTRTFAHVLTIDPARQAAYAQSFQTDQETCILTFRAPLEEIGGLVATGHPFFKMSWGPSVMGLVLTPETDWAEVEELLTDSYCLLAPQKLTRLVARPPGSAMS